MQNERPQSKNTEVDLSQIDDYKFSRKSRDSNDTSSARSASDEARGFFCIGEWGSQTADTKAPLTLLWGRNVAGSKNAAESKQVAQSSIVPTMKPGSSNG